jgi:hypothetical protein
MMKVNEIKHAIESLPQDEFTRLMHWIHQEDMKKWDSQIENDSKSGKLDFLLEETVEEEKKGTLRKL